MVISWGVIFSPAKFIFDFQKEAFCKLNKLLTQSIKLLLLSWQTDTNYSNQCTQEMNDNEITYITGSERVRHANDQQEFLKPAAKKREKYWWFHCEKWRFIWLNNENRFKSWLSQSYQHHKSTIFKQLNKDFEFVNQSQNCTHNENQLVSSQMHISAQMSKVTEAAKTGQKLNICMCHKASEGLQLPDSPVGVALRHVLTEPWRDASTFIACDQLQQAHLSKIHEPYEMQTAMCSAGKLLVSATPPRCQEEFTCL